MPGHPEAAARTHQRVRSRPARLVGLVVPCLGPGSRAVGGEQDRPCPAALPARRHRGAAGRPPGPTGPRTEGAAASRQAAAERPRAAAEHRAGGPARPAVEGPLRREGVAHGDLHRLEHPRSLGPARPAAGRPRVEARRTRAEGAERRTRAAAEGPTTRGAEVRPMEQAPRTSWVPRTAAPLQRERLLHPEVRRKPEVASRPTGPAPPPLPRSSWNLLPRSDWCLRLRWLLSSAPNRRSRSTRPTTSVLGSHLPGPRAAQGRSPGRSRNPRRRRLRRHRLVRPTTE